MGRLYETIPFQELAETIPKPKGELSGKGCKAFFEVRGGMALQVLKSYMKCSDVKVIEQFNGSWQMQLFCHMQLKEREQIRDLDMTLMEKAPCRNSGR